MRNIPGCLFSLRQSGRLSDGAASTCVWQYIIWSPEKVLGVCLQPQCEIASGYQTLLSPDIVKGFLPFASLSSLGLKDEKKMLCVRVCVCAQEIGVQSDEKKKKRKGYHTHAIIFHI